MALGTWVLVGLFVDGWAHNIGKPESFFTPWHGLFYSGYLATAAWMWTRYQRHRAVPAGYELGFAGMIAFAVGGVADMFWHLAFGVEQGLEALLSPSHLVLFVSGVLAVSSPLRAAWSDADGEPAPSLRAFLPTVLSTTAVTATVSFFLMQYSPFLTDAATRRPYRQIAERVDPALAGWLAEEVRIEGFAGILMTTLVLLAPSFLLLRRWQVPRGTFTLLFTAVVVLTSSLHGFEMFETVLSGLVAGAAADLLAAELQPSRPPSTVLRVVGFVVPVVLWLTYFAVLALLYDVGWSMELWSGITLMAGLAGLGLAVLMTLAVPTPTRSSPVAST